MLLISRPFDMDWFEHHDSVIKSVMGDLGFQFAGSGSDGKTRDLEFDHEQFDEEYHFYQLGMIDKVSERLPGVYLELRLFPYKSRVT